MTLQVGVGSFAKKADGTGTQTVTGVVDQSGNSFTPKVVMLLASREGAGSAGACRTYFGFATDDGEDCCVGWQQRGSGATTNCEVRGALKIMTMLENASNATAAECDLTAVASGQFTLDWTTNDADADIIQYMALGGVDLTNYEIVDFLTPAATGNVAVSGAGFEPDAVLFLYGGGSSVNNPGTQPTTYTYQWLDYGGGLGAMDAAGGQWASAVFNRMLVSTVDCSRGQITDGCIWMLGANQGSQVRASFVSMDSDGFTVNFSEATGGGTDRWRVFALCLKGTNFKAGNFTKSTSTSVPVSDPKTGVGFRPAGLLFATTHDLVNASVATHQRQGIGFSNAVTDGSVTAKSEDNVAAGSLDRDLITTTTYSLLKSNDDTGTPQASAVVDSVGADGFTLLWDVNDASATQYVYLAFGDAATPGVTPSISGASISYGSFTRTGINNTPFTLGFTPSDSDTTGANALNWQLRTGANRTGTLIASGTCTHNTPVSQGIAYNASGIVNGNQTVYLSVDDGALISADTALTLKRDDDPPTAATAIEVTPV